MGETYNVRLEPVGIEFEVDSDETVLRGAFRQGLMLMHGCKEGQCAACKSFLLDGEVDLDSYSNFALNDFEKEEGWTLLCRAHAETDLEVELINYDEEMLRSGIPMTTQQMRVERVEELTHDIRRLVLSGAEMQFKPGQYVDITIPGTDEVRSFSMANLPGQGELEFMIKLYPQGKFSGLLANGGIAEGDELEVYYYGARGLKDLFHLDELRELEEKVPGFRFVAALSDSDDDREWEGETGLITDVVTRLHDELGEVDAYLCGPPPMVDAAIAMLDASGVPEGRVYFDKFTTSAE